MLVMYNSEYNTWQLPYLHDQKSLTLYWHSVFGGSDIVTNHIASTASQYFDYG